MATFLVQPRSFTVVSGSASATNMNRDEPGLVWRPGGTSGSVTIQHDGTAWDTIALVNSNLRGTATVQVRAGASSGAVDGSSGLALNQTVQAYTGVAPAQGSGTITYITLAVPITSPFVRIDISDSGNPAGLVQVSRLVLGKRVEHDGITSDSAMTILDTSDLPSGLGWTAVNPFPTKRSWRVKMDGLTDTKYWNDYDNLLNVAGAKAGVLFVPDTDVAFVQRQAVFGRFTGQPVSIESPVADHNIVAFVITAI
jgi:hypothetical protein